MTILHNCASSEENLEYFYKESDIVSVIRWYAENITPSIDVSVLAL